jgi:hypothetical protein
MPAGITPPAAIINHIIHPPNAGRKEQEHCSTERRKMSGYVGDIF